MPLGFFSRFGGGYGSLLPGFSLDVLVRPSFFVEVFNRGYFAVVLGIIILITRGMITHTQLRVAFTSHHSFAGARDRHSMPRLCL